MHPSQRQYHDSVDRAGNSWRLSLLRSVMGDSICETGRQAVDITLLPVVVAEYCDQHVCFVAGCVLCCPLIYTF